MRVTKKIAENLENKANALIYWKSNEKLADFSTKKKWLIAVTVEV